MVKLGADRKTPYRRSGFGEGSYIVLNDIYTISNATDGADGHLLGQAIEDSPGQLTSGTIGHVEGVGLRGFEIEFEANGHTEEVTGPLGEGSAHDA